MGMDIAAPALAAALFAGIFGAFLGWVHATEKRGMQARFEARLIEERQAEFTRGWQQAWKEAIERSRERHEGDPP